MNRQANTYDVGIIGAGNAGIFAAYELSRLLPGLSVVIIEQGRNINERKCPIIEGSQKTCTHCKPCSIMKGFGGTGAFSDGKFNFTTQFGGWLNEYISEKEVMSFIEYVDSVNMKFGAPEERFTASSAEADKIRTSALGHDLHLLHAQVKHIGTERSFELISRLYNYLSDKTDILCNTKTEEIMPDPDGGFSLKLSDGKDLKCRYLIAAPGRAGAEWFAARLVWS